jgi:hypothetical protein
MMITSQFFRRENTILNFFHFCPLVIVPGRWTSCDLPPFIGPCRLRGQNEGHQKLIGTLGSSWSLSEASLPYGKVGPTNLGVLNI